MEEADTENMAENLGSLQLSLAKASQSSRRRPARRTIGVLASRPGGGEESSSVGGWHRLGGRGEMTESVNIFWRLVSVAWHRKVKNIS